MRSRAAILPYPGDPFLLHYWLKFYDIFWGNEVDQLYIYLNSPIELQVVDYIQELAAKYNANLQYESVQIEHGMAIDRTLDIVTEDLVMLVEDDGFIFKSGKVDEMFSYIESGDYDIVGSKRGSCSMEILTRSQQLYGLGYEGEGDQGPNFWPNFFFTKKDILTATDRNFGARAWNEGEKIQWLSRPGDEYYARGPVASDTFVNTSMQLLNMIPQNRIKYVPQYHGSPDDIEHYDRSYNLFDGVAYWCHIGSLSSGVGGILQDDKGRSLARRSIDPEKETTVLPNKPTTEQEKNEWERRVQWWLTFWEEREIGKIDDFAEAYGNAIKQVIAQFELSYTRIKRRQNLYKSIGL